MNLSKFNEDNEEFIEPQNYEYENDDDFGNDDANDELVQKIKQLNGIKSKRVRTEAVKDELDVNLSDKNKIKTHELLDSLKNLSNLAPIKKTLIKAKNRTRTLDTPLPRHLSEKAKRVTAYLQDKKEISKWEPIVKRNRHAEQLEFPLKQPDFSMKTAETFVQTWKPETDLEKEISELLQSSENNLKSGKLLTQAEQKALQAMSVEEMKTKRAEFFKLKALQQAQEKKFKRLKKIKSKRYRKILRKEKLKQESKQLEKLEKENPNEFKEKLKEIEKQRMEERMSLRHKKTSQWSKRQQIYAKYNDKVRDEISEQLEISKQLTKKIKELDENKVNSDEEIEENRETSEINTGLTLNIEQTETKNPWISFIPVNERPKSNKNDTTETVGDVVYEKPKAFVDQDEIDQAKDAIEGEDSEEDENTMYLKKVREERINLESSESEDEAEKQNDTETSLKTVTQDEPNSVQETITDKIIEESSHELSKPTESVQKSIDPNKILIAKIDDDDEQEEVEEDMSNLKRKFKNQIKHRLTLSEAFEDDDIVQEFKEEKKRVTQNEKVKPIDLSLPGWGDWTGVGIDPEEQAKKNKKRKRKLIIQPSPGEIKQRRDKHLKHVIISEKKDDKIASYQISELPRQYNSVADFEKTIGKSIGRTWNPESKYQNSIQPKVVTKIGSLIKPIEKEDFNFKYNERNFNRKQKNSK